MKPLTGPMPILCKAKPSTFVLAIVLSLTCTGMQAQAIVLQVDSASGAVLLTNESATATSVVAYSIASASGALLPANWLSIANQYDSNSGGTVDPDNTWLSFGATTTSLAEGATLGDGAILSPGQRINLGAESWNSSGLQDLTFSYVDGVNTTFDVLPIFGNFAINNSDFDSDGDVDGDDFLAWQTGFGSANASSLSIGDANANGAVDGTDFNLWQDAFGNVSATLNGTLANNVVQTSVPEPGTLASMLLLAFGVLLRLFR